jgi:hypothetical protein
MKVKVAGSSDCLPDRALAAALSTTPARSDVDDNAHSGTKAHVRAAHVDDLPAIWRFCAQSYDVYRGCSFEDFRAVWHHRWLDNPAASPGQPLGWILESAKGEVVGFAGIVPMRVKIGSQSFTAFCGANWSVRPEYRRHSLAIFRQYTALGASHVVLSTSVSHLAAPVHARAMQRIPVEHTDQSLWWIIDPKRLLSLKLAQLGKKSPLWKAVAVAAPALGVLGAAWPVVLGIYTDREHRILPWLARAQIAFDCPPLPVERVMSFDEEFDELWAEHRQLHDVIVERTAEFLHWRHVLLPRAAGECFVFACRERGRLLGYVALQTPGSRSDVPLPGCFNVTDLFYPPEREDVLGNLMNAAFQFAVQQGGTVLKLSGFHPVVQAGLASQRPCVIAPDTLRTLALGQFMKFGLKRKVRPADRPPVGSYWYKVPTEELAQICRSGSWWPSAIDGTSNL